MVFDSQLTTYAHLHQLNQRGIRFMTLRRRTRPMLRAIWSRPASAWRRITLPSLTRTFRTPKVLDERVPLNGYEGEVRQVTVIDLGHEEPTILLTNNFRSDCPALVTRYAQRMLIENGISEAIQFFHLDALSSMVGMKVDFDLQITLMASSLYRLMADRIGREYAKARPRRSSATCWTCRRRCRSRKTRWSSPWTSGPITPTSWRRDSRMSRPRCRGSATSC